MPRTKKRHINPEEKMNRVLQVARDLFVKNGLCSILCG